VDVRVNNAEISPGFVPAERIEDCQWSRVLEANLTGPFLCCKAAFPLMRAAGGGSIVNISRVRGARAHEPSAAYSVSSAGLEMLTSTLATEWAAQGIRVNCIAPECLRTALTSRRLRDDGSGLALPKRIPMRRLRGDDDVAAAVLFLASEASSPVTGVSLSVDVGEASR
jgi:NAD(P)-dependent dehydrogenase (short-subunit alcohol dehydrogenase family)